MLTGQQLKRARGPAAQEIAIGGFTPQKRRTKYGPTNLDVSDKIRQATKLILLGATDQEIADFFEISVRQLHKWKLMHPELAEAMRDAKEQIDTRVERTLYEKATGYTFDSEKIFCTDGVVTRVPVREHVPPSDTAMIFWLKNRKPQDWRDQRDVKLEGKIETSAPVDRELALAVLNMLVDAAGAESPLIEGEVEDATIVE